MYHFNGQVEHIGSRKFLQVADLIFIDHQPFAFCDANFDKFR
jgi:hypothetical protein